MIKTDKKTKNKKIFKHNKGFTLVEAMFAILFYICDCPINDGSFK
jgi:hypothetical protein